ncbi:MAG: HTH domain-containing protein [Bryobacteraceae bacterium]
MRRADRLFELLLWLRRKRAVTAAELARRLEVSERTIYRDIGDLMACGVPIDGEAGVGYRLHPGFELPPLMFTKEELDALRTGARIVESWADPKMARAAQSALARIEAVLPEKARAAHSETPVYAPGYFIDPETPALRAAAGSNRAIARSGTGVSRCGRAGKPPHGAASGVVLLGRELDARRLV